MRVKQLRAAAAICLISLLSLQAPTAWAAGPAPTGSALCVTCHDDEDLPDMSRSAHAAKNDKRTPDCITCHGVSDTHAHKPAGASKLPAPERSFGKKSTLSAQARSELCLSCHNKEANRALWSGSQHDSADLSCDTCHKVHANQDKSLAKASQADACLICHKTQRAQLSRASHHPVPEGRMTCSDCHNVHGSVGPKLARRDSTNATCYTCHAEKRGPFVHQHEPVNEDCTSCHNAHGSSVQAMLTARPPMLCQQCHTPHVAGAVGAVGGQPGVFAPGLPGTSGPQVGATTGGKNVVNLWQGRSCMNCHTQVHGSNNPSATNPTPQLLLR
jgi:DmsE family decaheme c-type cytochrome